jgi:hypothetical protein
LVELKRNRQRQWKGEFRWSGEVGRKAADMNMDAPVDYFLTTSTSPLPIAMCVGVVNGVVVELDLICG